MNCLHEAEFVFDAKLCKFKKQFSALFYGMYLWENDSDAFNSVANWVIRSMVIDYKPTSNAIFLIIKNILEMKKKIKFNDQKEKFSSALRRCCVPECCSQHCWTLRRSWMGKKWKSNLEPLNKKKLNLVLSPFKI